MNAICLGCSNRMRLESLTASGWCAACEQRFAQIDLGLVSRRFDPEHQLVRDAQARLDAAVRRVHWPMRSEQ